MSEPKNEHWVPQFYLRGFATPDTADTGREQVWLFSKDEGDPIVTSVRNVAAQRYLTSPKVADGTRDRSVDEKLSALESLVAPLWARMTVGMADFYVSESVRRILALFIATLFLRHPDRLDLTKRLRAQIVAMLEDVPKDAEGNPRVESVEHKGVVRPMDTRGWAQYRSAKLDDHKRSFGQSITNDATHVAQILLQKRWSVVIAEDAVFVTTDTPVRVAHPERATYGLGTPGSIVSVPLAPDRVLVMDDQHDEPGGRYYPLGPHGPAPFNLEAWRSCRRFMVSSRHPDSVLAEIVTWADEQAELARTQ